MEDGWNGFRKTIYEVADGVLGKKVKTAARNISEKALCSIERRRGRHVRRNFFGGPKTFETAEIK